MQYFSIMSSKIQRRHVSTQHDDDNDDDEREEEEEEEDDVDDYMSFVVTEPVQKETSLQRQARLKREAAIRGRPKSKAELAEDERRKREEGLNRSLLEDKSSKGFKMMQAMGFKSSQGLGKASGPTTPTASNDETTQPSNNRTFEPLRPIFKESRAGIGHEDNLKRKMLDDLDNDNAPMHKKQAMTPEDYRERVRLESLAKRYEAQFHAAQKICDRFYTGGDVNGEEDANSITDNTNKKPSSSTEPTFSQIKSTPILWRGLLHHRALTALRARMRHDLMQSGPLSYANISSSDSKLPGFTDPDMDADDKLAMGREEVAFDDEWEDLELDEFEQRDIKERLDEIVEYLRTKWLYCFWCKHKYASQEEMDESCPGPAEDDHD